MKRELSQDMGYNGIMNKEAIERFIEYMENMILLCEKEYVRDSRGCYLKDEYLKGIVTEAKRLIKYGEAEIALENILENLSEVSIDIDQEAANLVKQAFGEKYSNRIERMLSSLGTMNDFNEKRQMEGKKLDEVINITDKDGVSLQG